jgi:hypothetical protein
LIGRSGNARPGFQLFFLMLRGTRSRYRIDGVDATDFITSKAASDAEQKPLF